MSNPTLLQMPLAVNGDKNTIPVETGSNTGLFSQKYGFQSINSLPLSAGGKAISRHDYNGAMYLLSNILFYAQKGFTFEFDSTQAYYKDCEVIDPLDGNKYRCIADVAAEGDNPSEDTTGAHWERMYNDSAFFYRLPNTAYGVDDIKYAAGLPNGCFLVCMTAGTSASADLTVPVGTVVGDVITDGTVTWRVNSFMNLQRAVAESTGYGIVSGCTPSISGLTVTVGAGVVHLADGTRKEIASTTVTLDAADSTNPRIDLVYITSAGVVAKVTGTAAASPVVPALPTGGISVCNVKITAGATAGAVTDARKYIDKIIINNRIAKHNTAVNNNDYNGIVITNYAATNVDYYKNVAIPAIKFYGFDSASIMIPFYQNDITASTFDVSRINTDSLTTIIQLLNDNDIKVVLDFHAETYDSTWRANINPTNKSEWFANYTNAIKNVLTGIEDSFTDSVVIGSEMRTLTVSENDSYWIELIKSIREIYSGKITYGYNLNASRQDEVHRLLNDKGFAEYLDYINIHFYAVDDVLSYESLTRDQALYEIERALDNYGQYYTTNNIFDRVIVNTGKPIVIGEFGGHYTDSSIWRTWIESQYEYLSSYVTVSGKFVWGIGHKTPTNQEEFPTHDESVKKDIGTGKGASPAPVKNMTFSRDYGNANDFIPLIKIDKNLVDSTDKVSTLFVVKILNKWTVCSLVYVKSSNTVTLESDYHENGIDVYYYNDTGYLYVGVVRQNSTDVYNAIPLDVSNRIVCKYLSVVADMSGISANLVAATFNNGIIEKTMPQTSITTGEGGSVSFDISSHTPGNLLKLTVSRKNNKVYLATIGINEGSIVVLSCDNPYKDQSGGITLSLSGSTLTASCSYYGLYSGSCKEVVL